MVCRLLRILVSQAQNSSQPGSLRGEQVGPGEEPGRASARLAPAGAKTRPGVPSRTSSTGKPPVSPKPRTRRILGWRSEIMICISASRSEMASGLSRWASRSTWIVVPQANLSLAP